MRADNFHWNRTEELFHAALDRPAAERHSWLELQTTYDAGIRAEVKSLLAALRDHEELIALPPAKQETAADSPEPQPSATFGPYQTIRLLGRGGMGAVYLAKRTDGQFDQTVALKVMAAHLAGDSALKRFQTERQLLASLNHPNIARMFDGGLASSGDPYLVMEFVEGRALDCYCDSQKLGIEQRLRLLLQVCEAVDYAHRNFVLHRDLKPGNIMVAESANGNAAAVKLLDFGTASLIAEDSDVTITRQLTPRYASPEELRGERANTSSDIFSLGVILYELLTGAWPFGNLHSIFSEMNRAMREVAVKPFATAVTAKTAESRSLTRDQLGRLLKGDLSAITLKALDHDPSRRYETVRQFADDITAYLEGRPVLARPQTGFYRTGKFLRRRWRPVTAAAVFVLSLSAASIIAVRQAGVARAEAIKAEKVNIFLNNMLSSADRQNFDPERFTVAQMLESSEPLLAKSWKDDPLAKATIQRSLGVSYTTLHRLDRSRTLLESALETFRSRGDEKEVAETLRVLADNFREGGHVADAVILLDEALRHVRHMGKSAPPRLAFNVVNDLASLLDLYLNQRLTEARLLFDEAISIANRDSSVPRADLAICMARRAGMLGDEPGKAEEAEAMIRKALAVGRQEDDGGIWEIVPLNDLRLLHSKKDDFIGARDFARQTYEAWERNVGPDNPNTANALAVWARYLSENGETAESIRQIRAALPIIRKSWAPGNFNRWTSLVAAARIHCMASLFSEAESYAREANELVDGQHLPEMDARRAESLSYLGTALLGQKRYREALPVLQRDVAIYRQLGPARKKSLQRAQALLDEVQSKMPR